MVEPVPEYMDFYRKNYMAEPLSVIASRLSTIVFDGMPNNDHHHEIALSEITVLVGLVKDCRCDEAVKSLRELLDRLPRAAEREEWYESLPMLYGIYSRTNQIYDSIPGSRG